ncbi:YggU family protein [Myxococcaceae bacterium JPH2]|nr:YggU family protein [Myxococcaceae bacterium JPH2]
MAPPWLRVVPDGIELTVLVQPRASRTRVVGEHDGQLKIQLAAPPVDGEANAALVEFLAKQLGVPRRQVTLTAGDASRRKRVVVQGIDAARAEAVISGKP